MTVLPDQWRNVTEWSSLAAEANTSATLATVSLREAEQQRVDAEADLAQKLETQGGFVVQATRPLASIELWSASSSRILS